MTSALWNAIIAKIDVIDANVDTLSNPDIEPTANFDWTDQGSGNVEFDDTSTISNPTGVTPNAEIAVWMWDYGDGSVFEEKTDSDPFVHNYVKGGSYQARLFVATNYGWQHIVTKTVTVYYGPTAGFSFEQISDDPPTVKFTDQSFSPEAHIINRVWDFDDGNPTVDKLLDGSPFTYTFPRLSITRDVELTVTDNNANEDADQQAIAVTTLNLPPVAIFTPIAQEDPGGYRFIDDSTDAENSIAEWVWDYGDGDSDTFSVSTNPVHVYSANGGYIVSLSVTDDAGQVHTSRQQITVDTIPDVPAPVPVPEYRIEHVSGKQYQFFDESADPNGTITNWLWEYGDGSSLDTGASSDPLHTYTANGTYQTKLTVTGAGGVLYTHEKELTVSDPPVSGVPPDADFEINSCKDEGGDNYLVSFADKSTPGTNEDGQLIRISHWSWDFDDGSPVVEGRGEQNPNHQYTSTGSYDIELTITDSLGRKDTKIVTYNTTSCTEPTGEPPVADFDWTIISGLTVEFDDTSQVTDAAIVEWTWNFGDGTTTLKADSIAFNHVFPQKGTYLVTLRVEDVNGQTDVTTKSIFVSGVGTICERPTTPESISVVYDDDPANEGDGPYGVAYTICSPEIDLKAIGVIGWNTDALGMPNTNPAHSDYENYPARRSYLVANRSRCLLGFNDTTIPLHHGYTASLVGGNGDDENPAFDRDLSTNPEANPPRTVAAVAYADLIEAHPTTGGRLWFVVGGQVTNLAAAMRILIEDGRLTQSQINQRIIVIIEMFRVIPDSHPQGYIFTDQQFNMAGDPVAFKIICEAQGLVTYVLWDISGMGGYSITEANHPPGTPASGSGGDPLLDYALDRRKTGVDTALDPALPENPQPPGDPATFSNGSVWNISALSPIYVALKRGLINVNYNKRFLNLPTYKQTGVYGDRDNLANYYGGGRIATFYDIRPSQAANIVTDFWTKVRPFDVPDQCGVTNCNTITNFST